MAFKANLIIPALLTKCLFVYFQLYLVYLVKSTGYIMNWNQIKELLFWLSWKHYGLESKSESLFWPHRKQSIAIIINIIANCQTILISSHVSITLI